jgi:SMI1 / KNR4 family (SUKH-1)
MKRLDWDGLKDRVTLIGDELRVVSDKELDAFESETGFKLPESYRQFCKVFGAGTLARPDTFNIAVPGLTRTYPAFELRSFNLETRDFSREYKVRCARPDLFERAWFFGDDIGTSYYFWDPQEVIDKHNAECAIYVMLRSWELLRIADTFWNFIVDVCLGTGIPGTKQTDAIEWVFEPAPVEPN